MDGMTVPEMEKWNLSITFPLFSTIDLDLEGLKLILAQAVSLLVGSTYPLPGTDVVVIVR